MFDADKNRMIGLLYNDKNYDDMLSRFHLVPERHGRTDGRTDIFAISKSRVLTRDKKSKIDSVTYGQNLQRCVRIETTVTS